MPKAIGLVGRVRTRCSRLLHPFARDGFECIGASERFRLALRAGVDSIGQLCARLVAPSPERGAGSHRDSCRAKADSLSSYRGPTLIAPQLAASRCYQQEHAAFVGELVSAFALGLAFWTAEGSALGVRHASWGYVPKDRTSAIAGQQGNSKDARRCADNKKPRQARFEMVRSVELIEYGVPRGIRTPVVAVKGRCPGPLDDGDAETLMVVELIGIEPMTSTMPL